MQATHTMEQQSSSLALEDKIKILIKKKTLIIITTESLQEKKFKLQLESANI